MKSCIVTIASKNHLCKAKTLAESVESWNSDYEMILVLCDSKSQPVDMPGFTSCLYAGDLGIDQFLLLSFRYNQFELNTALKPFVAKYLFSKMGYEKVIYLDSDMYVCSPLDTVFQRLSEWDIVLTPHMSRYLTDDGFRPNESDYLKSGAFNMGFFGLSNSPNAIAFLDWWSNHVANDCIVDPNKGIFVDQKWIDLVPGIFDRVCIEKNAGWNVGYWSLRDRTISMINNQLQIDGVEVVFFHFSGFAPDGQTFSAHQNRFDYKNLPNGIVNLCREYEKRLIFYMKKLDIDCSYGFSYFCDGEYIPDIVRRKFHFDYRNQIIELNPSIPDFRSKLYEHLNNLEIIEGVLHPLLSRLAFFIYQSRPDLQMRYSVIGEDNGARFANWFVNSANRVYDLPIELVKPVEDRLKKLGKYSKFSATYWYNQSRIVRNIGNRFMPESWKKN